MCEKHDFRNIFGLNGGEYEPSATVFWCKQCGMVIIQDHYDGREISRQTFKPQTTQKVAA